MWDKLRRLYDVRGGPFQSREEALGQNGGILPAGTRLIGSASTDPSGRSGGVYLVSRTPGGRGPDLRDARAFSSSLGMTAKGRLDLARNTVDMEGTIVPAYFFNSLLWHIPLLGKLFSPEKGGGVFAATYTLRGGLDNPRVAVNPLAALTPGFLRGVFGLFEGSKPPVGEQSR